MQARFVKGNYAARDYTPGSAVAAGDIVVDGGLALIAHHDIPANTLGAMGMVGGEYACTAATGDTFSIGDDLYWDDTGDEGSASATSTTYLGKVTRDKASGPLEVYFEHALLTP